jgi:hypothetical protein
MPQLHRSSVSRWPVAALSKGASRSALGRAASQTAVLLLAGLTVLATATCSDSDSPTRPRDEAVFLIHTCVGSQHSPQGELFRILTRDPVVIAQGEALAGTSVQRVVGGNLAPGHGGFNEPWSWHMRPETVQFSEQAIELCDGCPSFVEDDLDYWLNTVGQYCPWGAEVVRRER